MSFPWPLCALSNNIYRSLLCTVLRVGESRVICGFWLEKN